MTIGELREAIVMLEVEIGTFITKKIIDFENKTRTDIKNIYITLETEKRSNLKANTSIEYVEIDISLGDKHQITK